MHFVIMAFDKENSLELRVKTREAHLAYLKEAGAIRLGGPFLDAKGDMKGSLVILEAPDMDAAKKWAANDPYAKAGLFARTTIEAWKPTANFCDAKL
jgi:uncharacterized protein YciI